MSELKENGKWGKNDQIKMLEKMEMKLQYTVLFELFKKKLNNNLRCQ